MDPRYIHLMRVLNYFVFRQEISQRAILITVVIEGYPRGLLEFSSYLDLQSIIVHHGSIQVFPLDKVDHQQTVLV